MSGLALTSEVFMRARLVSGSVSRRRGKRPLGIALAVALGVGVLGGVPAQAAPPSAPADVAAAEEAARAAAAEQAPPVQIPEAPVPPALGTLADTDDEPAPVLDERLEAALAQAAATGKPVEVAFQTTESLISFAQPDGTVTVESAAGPVRTDIDGEWLDVDTTLEFTASGVRPAAVTGEIVFSDGGTEPMAVLGDGEQASISLDWAGSLPRPVLEGNKATYPDVFPDVDLVLTATRLGFEQHLLVNERPDAATLEALSTLEFPMATEGATVTEGEGGQLAVVDPAGTPVGNAAAPLMWDARTDPRTDEPVAVEEIGLELAAPSAPEDDATLVLTPPQEFLTDPATVYPVTIDPTQVLGALGDTFVQSNAANTPHGGLTELRVGTYGSGVAARSLLRFDVGPVRDRAVQSANLALFENHSWSCQARWVDIRGVWEFDPNTVTWNTQPFTGDIVANANVAAGYSSACPARWVDFNLTNMLRTIADSRNGWGTVMALAVTAAENDVYAWKKFNSGNAAGNVPLLTFAYDPRCDQYAGMHVCGAIRDKYYALGGPWGSLGMPTTNENLLSGGAFSHFQHGSIYWSPSTGAHAISGPIRDRWSQLGWENSSLGYPTTDRIATPNRAGAYNHFTGGSIYWSQATGAWEVTGLIRDKWAATGWENGPLGFPTSGRNGTAQPNSFHQTFERDAVMYQAAGAPAAYWVTGPIRAKYATMISESSFLGFPTSDPTAMAGGTYNHFQGGSVLWSQPTGAAALRGPIRDKYAALGWATSTLGFPTSDEKVVMKTVETTTTAADGTETTTTQQVATEGRYTDFTGGSIYWSAATGAHTLAGGMLAYWRQAASSPSSLGLPVTDEYATSYGRRQDFQRAQLLLFAGEQGPRECTITGTSGPDQITGTDGDDFICGLDGDDVINALGGNDAVSGDGGNDRVNLGPGNDAATGGVGVDSIIGESGDDFILGDVGNDVLEGGAGFDTVLGGHGADQLLGGDDADDLDGGPEVDVIDAGAGDDIVSGGDGNDEAQGGPGADHVSGGEGVDLVFGGDGDDALTGGLGSDRVSGGAGDDTVSGGPSTDTVDGGGESDRCITGDDASATTSCEELLVTEGPDATASLVTALSASEGAIVPALPSGGGAFVMTGQSSQVTAPTSTVGAVQLTTHGIAVDGTPASATIALGLPLADSSTQAVAAHDGTVVYPDAQGGGSVTVQALTTGEVQVSAVLPSAAAPNRLRFAVALPVGARLQLSDAGEVAIVAADESILGKFDPAWARDATGASVPTAYEIDGSTIVQTVDLGRPDTVFPVVADPRLTFGWGIYLNMVGAEWKLYAFVFKAALGGGAWYGCNAFLKRLKAIGDRGPGAWLANQLCSLVPNTIATFMLYLRDNWLGWMRNGTCYQLNMVSRITRTYAKIVPVSSRNC